MTRKVRLTQSARRRKIGIARVTEAMADAHGVVIIPATGEYDQRSLYVGRDHTGLELEIIAAEMPEYTLVIHVMPTEWRRQR